MTHNWDYKPIGDCFVYIKNGANISQAKDSGGIPITRIETLSNGLFNRSKMGYANILEPGKYAQNVLNDGDLLMSHINSKSYIGRTVMYEALPNEVIIHGMNLLRLIPNETTLSKFFYYFTLSHYFKSKIAKIRKDAVNQSSFSITDLKKINIPVPPLAEQQQIVAELDKINETIEDCRELLRNLDALAQSLFYDTFGDPITNPKGWPLYKLSSISQLINGRAYKQNELLDEGKYKVIRVGNFFTNSDYYYSDLELSPEKYIDYGDLIFAWSASFGAFIWQGDKVIYHYHIWKILFDDNLLNKIFYKFLLNEMTSSFMKDLHGIGMMHLTKAGMENYMLPVPPLSLQEQFAARIEQIELQKKAVEQTIAELQTLLDSRMDYWFN